MKTLWKNFKKLIMRGNIVDLAIGVMVGGAFGKITTSLANDIVMPPISYLLKGVHFSELKYVIAEATETQKEVAINYGNFIQVIVDFFIITLSVCIFAIVINKLRDAANENLEMPFTTSILFFLKPHQLMIVMLLVNGASLQDDSNKKILMKGLLMEMYGESRESVRKVEGPRG